MGGQLLWDAAVASLRDVPEQLFSVLPHLYGSPVSPHLLSGYSYSLGSTGSGPLKACTAPACRDPGRVEADRVLPGSCLLAGK